MDFIKVAGSSKVNKVAGSIAIALRDKDLIDIQAIGPNAVNQAVKAIATARGILTPKGLDLVCVPTYIMIKVEDGERTGISFRIERIKK